MTDARTPAHACTVAELLTEVVQMLADGRASEPLAPVLGGAALMASEKKSGGILPIAVGEVLRRLTTKALCQVVKERAQEHL